MASQETQPPQQTVPAAEGELAQPAQTPSMVRVADPADAAGRPDGASHHPRYQPALRGKGSARASMENLREVLFAGFPCKHPHPSRFKGLKPGSPAARALFDPVAFPGNYVLSVFKEYGPIERFVFDENRGIGSCTFARGEDAEACFLSLNLSLVPSPEGSAGPSDPKGERVGFGEWESADLTSGARSRSRDLLLVCEFAQLLPFINPYMLLKDELRVLECSRAMLKTLPVLERRFQNSAAEEVVAGYQPVKEGSAELKLVGPLWPMGTGYLEPDALSTALWRCLKPEGLVKKAGNYVTALDLWWEYYNLYMLLKTEPEPSRIKRKTDFLFASCASVEQEIMGLQRDNYEHNVQGSSVVSASPTSFLRRLVYDDVYHNTLNCVLLRSKLKLDPSYVSLMRDIYSDKTTTEVTDFYAERRSASGEAAPSHDVAVIRMKKVVDATLAREDGGAGAAFAQQSAAAAMEAAAAAALATATSAKDDAAKGKSSGAAAESSTTDTSAAVAAAVDEAYESNKEVQEWLSMPILELVANIITNVRFLRRVKAGKVNPDGSDKVVEQPAGAASSKADDGGAAAGAEAAESDPLLNEENNFGYPGMSVQQEDEDFYGEILTSLDGFCEDGSLFSLLIVGERPDTFRSVQGHLGYEETRMYYEKKNRSSWSGWRDVLKALIVPSVFVLLIVLLVLWVSGHAPEEDMTVETGSGKPERRPTFEPLEKRWAANRQQSKDAADGAEAAAGVPRENAGRREAAPVPSAEELKAWEDTVKSMTPEELVERRRAAANAAQASLQRAREAAEARGAKFKFEFNADL